MPQPTAPRMGVGGEEEEDQKKFADGKKGVGGSPGQENTEEDEREGKSFVGIPTRLLGPAFGASATQQVIGETARPLWR